MKKAIPLAAIILITASGAAQAQQTISVCDTIPRQTFSDLTLTLPVPEFPYPECDLLDAEVVLNLAVDGRFFGENTGNCGPLGCSWDDSVYISLALSDLDGSPLFADFIYEAAGVLTGYDGVFDFGGTSGYTSPFARPAYTGYVMNYDDLSIFDNPVNNVVDAEAFSRLRNPGNGAYGIATYIQAQVCATYVYECATAVESSTWGGIKARFRD